MSKFVMFKVLTLHIFVVRTPQNQIVPEIVGERDELEAGRHCEAPRTCRGCPSGKFPDTTEEAELLKKILQVSRTSSL